MLYYIWLYRYMMCVFYVHCFHKICKHFYNPLCFPCCRLFSPVEASDAKPGHCHCCGCPMMTTPNHHHHPESLTPSDLTGSMSMMPTTTRSCQLWFAPSSVPRAELRMELVELPKSCSCTYVWLSFLERRSVTFLNYQPQETSVLEQLPLFEVGAPLLDGWFAPHVCHVKYSVWLLNPNLFTDHLPALYI